MDHVDKNIIVKKYIHSDGTEVWYIPDEEFGPISDENFTWFQWHREDGPAYKDEAANAIEYWFNNDYHRYEGPAVQHRSEDYTLIEWYLHGNQIDGEEYTKWLLEMGMDIDNLTPEDKVLIDLKWKT